MGKASEQRIYEFGDFRLHTAHLMLFRGGEEIQLPPKAVETLLALIARRGEIVSKAELLDAVWPATAVEESNLFFYLSVLRKTLGTRADGRPWIETYRRRGYRFAADGRSRPAEGPESHYAWIVGLDGENGPSVQTQSGRMYILRDPLLDERHSATASFIGDQVKPSVEAVYAIQEKQRPHSTSVFVMLCLAAFAMLAGAGYLLFRLTN